MEKRDLDDEIKLQNTTNDFAIFFLVRIDLDPNLYNFVLRNLIFANLVFRDFKKFSMISTACTTLYIFIQINLTNENVSAIKFSLTDLQKCLIYFIKTSKYSGEGKIISTNTQAASGPN